MTVAMATKVLPEQARALEDALLHMTFRQALSVLLNLGVPAEDILGLDHCREHYGKNELPRSSPLNFEGHTMWCKGCWKWWQL